MREIVIAAIAKRTTDSATSHSPSRNRNRWRVFQVARASIDEAIDLACEPLRMRSEIRGNRLPVAIPINKIARGKRRWCMRIARRDLRQHRRNPCLGQSRPPDSRKSRTRSPEKGSPARPILSAICGSRIFGIETTVASALNRGASPPPQHLRNASKYTPPRRQQERCARRAPSRACRCPSGWNRGSSA